MRCILYIVKRTQLYLEDNLWEALHLRARSEDTTISELVRSAARDRYLPHAGRRLEAMRAVVGIRPAAPSADAVREVRRLCAGTRLDRLALNRPARPGA